MESYWTGNVENAFFRSDYFDRCRILKQPEYEASGRTSKNQYYVLSVDVGRTACATVVCVLKVTPQPTGQSIKSLVNIYVLNNEHFGDQALKIKQLYFKYNARRVVIDANGLGIGLIDFMVKPSIDPDTNEVFPPFGVYNDDKNNYKKYKTDDMEFDAMFLVKADAGLNTAAHTNFQVQLTSGRVKMLIDERDARQKLLGTRVGQKMTPIERSNYLKPYTLTSILKEEVLNLREENEGVNIILKQGNKRIPKDKFSASKEKGDRKNEFIYYCSYKYRSNHLVRGSKAVY